MHLVRITREDGTQRWVATQGDGKTITKENGGTWEVVDVPTDKPGLLAFIDEMQSRINEAPVQTEAAPVSVPVSSPVAERPAPARSEKAQRKAELIAKSQDITALGDWLLDAEPWQVERIFDMLADRYREAVKKN
jgi:hypothetical protein